MSEREDPRERRRTGLKRELRKMKRGSLDRYVEVDGRVFDNRSWCLHELSEIYTPEM